MPKKDVKAPPPRGCEDAPSLAKPTYLYPKFMWLPLGGCLLLTRLPAMPSFDIVSKVDPQTLENAINTAKKELATRYDLRDTKGGMELDKKANTVLLSSENSMRIKALEDILLTRIVKQGIDGTALDFTAEEQASGNLVKKTIKVRAGVDKEAGRKIIKTIKDSKIKVEAQMQDDQIRVSAKKIDDLQAVIALLRRTDNGQPLQFVNMK